MDKSILTAIAKGVAVQVNQNPLGNKVISCPAPIVGEKAEAINPNNIVAGSEEIVTLVVTNTTGNTVLVPLGTELGIAGTGSKYGECSLSVDIAGVTDQYGNATPKVGIFARMASKHAVLAKSVKIFYTDGSAEQARQSAQSVAIDYNGDKKVRKMGVVEVNKDLNFAQLISCPTPMSMTKGILYPVLKDETVTIEIAVGAYALTEDFTTNQGY